MTMNSIWTKLRKYHKDEYRQFSFCVFLAVLLITSYIFVLLSTLIQRTLPEGGDSRKQIYMIFALAVVGCILFILYATGLFFRFKSRQLGTFIALGAPKSVVTKAYLTELIKILLKYCMLGLLTGAGLSLIIGFIFLKLASKTNTHPFALTLQGLFSSLIYIAVLILIVLIVSMNLIRRSNIMDIINAHRKQEPLKKNVTRRYFHTSLICLIVGVAGALLLPQIIIRIFEVNINPWNNLFYIPVLIGLYRILLYSIARHKRGKNPQKYYDNIINYGMLKLQGVSIVRNMLVISLLIMGGLFAIYYPPTQLISVGSMYNAMEDGYSIRYPSNASEVTKEDILSMADNYKTKVSNYREVEFVMTLGDGVSRDNYDSSGKIIEEKQDPYAAYECISASGYETLTGTSVNLASGEYYLITSENPKENIFIRFGDMSKLYLQSDSEYIDMRYKGNLEYNILLTDSSFGKNSRFVVSDEDYNRLREGAENTEIIKQMLFDTPEDDNSLLFSKALFKEFVERMSDNMNVVNYYNSYSSHVGDGDSYLGLKAIVDADTPERENDWRYAPMLVHLAEENLVFTLAIQLLLFIYVAIICFAAIAVIEYTRSQSVGISSRQVFMDLSKLGATKKYLNKILRAQIRKVFILPTVIGCIGMFSFELLLVWLNDGRIDSGELLLQVPVLLITLLLAALQYVLYRFSLKKVSGQMSI